MMALADLNLFLLLLVLVALICIVLIRLTAYLTASNSRQPGSLPAALTLLFIVIAVVVAIGFLAWPHIPSVQPGAKSGLDEEPRTVQKNPSALKVDPEHTPPEDRRPPSYRD